MEEDGKIPLTDVNCVTHLRPLQVWKAYQKDLRAWKMKLLYAQLLGLLLVT